MGSIQHFLAYGNSDQASFRDLAVRDTFDVMSVPGTIASYYREATAAFVLTSDVSYAIDPRTPVFQGSLDSPRASHITLAEWHGQDVLTAVNSPGGAVFDASFWTPSRLDTMTDQVIEVQSSYAGSLDATHPKMDRYERLLAEALGDAAPGVPSQKNASQPKYVLAPYFAVLDYGDDWYSRQEAINLRLSSNSAVSRVVCVDVASGRSSTWRRSTAELLGDPTHGVNVPKFLWLANFDERRASATLLSEVRGAISDVSSAQEISNMYGGYFSICLSKDGLWGFGNGLTYSEARDWHTLASTGAAPARYYLPRLHAFAAPAVAETVIQLDAFHRCDCATCEGAREAGRTVVSMTYHELKSHFALSRAAEIAFVESSSPLDLIEDLDTSCERIRRLVELEPTRLRGLGDMSFLDRWAQVLR